MIRRPVRDSGRSRLSRRDLLRVGTLGLRSRRVRAALSALGISIGIAAIVGVLGISQSSKTGLLSELGQLGNLLTAQPQSTAFGQQTELPVTSEGMVSRIGPVTSVTEIGSIANVYVYRNSFVPASDTSGISLTAADAALPATLGATLAHGTFLNAATARYPAVVLGAEAAGLLGINDLAHSTQVLIGGHWFTVVGILNPVVLLSQMDSMAFIGFPIAEQYFGFDGHPTGLYLRSVPSQVNAVAAVLPATVDPASPSVVAVSYPSDILKAEVAAKGAYNGLLVGLGAVALLVGGVGIANVMVISVLERRSEIGLRRALGATRRHVAEQFLAEAVLLSVLGGLAGTIIGAAATVIYAVSQHWSVQIPAVALYGGLGAALVIGTIAGLYPSMRAARLSPTEALRTVLVPEPRLCDRGQSAGPGGYDLGSHVHGVVIAESLAQNFSSRCQLARSPKKVRLWHRGVSSRGEGMAIGQHIGRYRSGRGRAGSGRVGLSCRPGLTPDRRVRTRQPGPRRLQRAGERCRRRAHPARPGHGERPHDHPRGGPLCQSWWVSARPATLGVLGNARNPGRSAPGWPVPAAGPARPA
ncbi:MAG TPA: ABC transporter permease [Streptosporangiaceae bacterium]|nr:ABC transporter permease [Streptosporangiaceae bacterium]